MALGISHRPDSPSDHALVGYRYFLPEKTDSEPVGGNENKHATGHHRRENMDNSGQLMIAGLYMLLERVTPPHHQLTAYILHYSKTLCAHL